MASCVEGCEPAWKKPFQLKPSILNEVTEQLPKIFPPPQETVKALAGTFMDFVVNNYTPDELKVDADSSEPVEKLVAVKIALDLLDEGEVIAIPNDTFYELVCDAYDIDALNKLYSMSDNPKPNVILCLGGLREIKKYAKKGFLKPVVLGKKRIPLVSEDHTYLNPFEYRVGVRVPKNPFLRVLAKELGRPLAFMKSTVIPDPDFLPTCTLWPFWSQTVFEADWHVPVDGIRIPLPSLFRVVREGQIVDAYDTFATQDARRAVRIVVIRK